MQIEILKNWNTTSHTLKVGDIVDMRCTDAEMLIADKKAKKTKEYLALEKKAKVK